MIKQAESLVKRYKIIQSRLPTIDFKNKDDKDLLIEFKKIKPIVELYQQLLLVQKEITDCKEILCSSKESNDYKKIALEEKEALEIKEKPLLEKLKLLLTPEDPYNKKNVIIEIRAGTGGDESSLFAYDLFRAYSFYIDKKKFKLEIMAYSTSDTKGYKEVVFSVSGHNAYKYFKHETGVHRVQRVPETESSGRIHTSTITVAVLLEAEENEIDIKENDLRIDTYRASGSGGQHVNKTDSAVRLTHLPTSIVVTCQDEKSQIKNKTKAMKVLRARIYEKHLLEEKQKRDSLRKQQVGTGDRSEKIRTYNFPQGRVTDHRINKTLHKLDFFLEGNMDEMIQALLLASTELKD